jgi:hypothetical protein
MKKFIKKLIRYDKIYDYIKDSPVYGYWKKINGKIANYLNDNPSKDFFII